jgi:hypothetical protein
MSPPDCIVDAKSGIVVPGGVATNPYRKKLLIWLRTVLFSTFDP